jgi:mannose-6-phosphate isomerase-like protein (cupin superfamily)
MATLIIKDDLPGNQTSRKFEGQLYAANISFFISETPPGKGPQLHKHPYEEVFVVQAGRLTFTVGDETVEVSGGQVVIAPAGTPHKFVNSGDEAAYHLDIHVSPQMQTEWLEA